MTDSMNPLAHDLSRQIQFAERGIVSKTLYDSPALKLVLFCFEEGQTLSEHTAPFEAVIHVVEGKATVRLGDEDHEASPGALYVMPKGLVHAVKASGRFVFLLTLVKERPLTALRS
ncbi:MAG: cupin domain-containing protein [Acidobacteriota bacterium]